MAWMARRTPMKRISSWPGGSGRRVPTSVAYGSQGEISSWGFQCTEDTCSNLNLTVLIENADGQPISTMSPHANRRPRLTDFLRCLYRHVKRVISSALGVRRGTWAKMAMEFHFILPEAFRTAEAPSRERFTNEMKGILREVGIGTESNHYAVLGFTQMEATSMVALDKQASRTPDGLLVFVSERRATLLERDLSEGEGLNCYKGSVACLPRLDDVFAKYVLWRLRLYPGVEDLLGSGVAQELVQGPDFGAIVSAVNCSAPEKSGYKLRAASIPPSFTHYDLGIEGGAMFFTQ